LPDGPRQGCLSFKAPGTPVVCQGHRDLQQGAPARLPGLRVPSRSGCQGQGLLNRTSLHGACTPHGCIRMWLTIIPMLRAARVEAVRGASGFTGPTAIWARSWSRCWQVLARMICFQIVRTAMRPNRAEHRCRSGTHADSGYSCVAAIYGRFYYVPGTILPREYLLHWTFALKIEKVPDGAPAGDEWVLDLFL